MQTIYLASPWFNKTQSERETRVKEKLRSLGFNVWSPRDNNDLSPITDPNIRKQVFNNNLDAMQICDVIFAITDEKDMGTIWEAGYVRGLNEDTFFNDTKTIVYYCETLGNSMFNLMLAESGDIVFTKFEEIDMLKDLLKNGKERKYAGIVE